MTTAANDNLQRVIRKLVRAHRDGSGCRLSRRDVRDVMDATLTRQTDAMDGPDSETDPKDGAVPALPVKGDTTR